MAVCVTGSVWQEVLGCPRKLKNFHSVDFQNVTEKALTNLALALL